MKRIDSRNKIFESLEFLKDKAKFSLIIQNLDNEGVELYSDEESYVVCRGKVGLPTWIWTKDDIELEKVKEIISVMELYLTESEKDQFTCKKEFYQLLVRDGYEKLNVEDYFEMGSLSCKETKAPKPCLGMMTVPKREDKETLVKYWYQDCIEMNGVDAISIEQAEADVESFLSSGTFYVWRDDKEKIVCMVSYKQIKDQARLNHVYTPVEERKKGYAANLIYQLTQELLKKGLLPLLYTDYQYEASNKAYKNAGYEDLGVLINFSCSKEKKKVY